MPNGSEISFMKRRKRRGPRTLPWGTPLETEQELDRQEPTRTGLSTVSEERLNPVEEIAGNAITLEFVYKFRVRNGVKCSLEVNVGNNCGLFVCE